MEMDYFETTSYRFTNILKKERKKDGIALIFCFYSGMHLLVTNANTISPLGN